jgi:hypothetical protein
MDFLVRSDATITRESFGEIRGQMQVLEMVVALPPIGTLLDCWDFEAQYVGHRDYSYSDNAINHYGTAYITNRKK